MSRVGALRAVRRIDSGQVDNSLRAIPGLGADAETRVPPASRRADHSYRGDARSVQTEEDGTLLRSISSIISFLIAAAKVWPKSSAALKSRNVAISASSPIARDVSGTSLDTSLPRCRVNIANSAKGAVSAAVIGTSSVFCRRTCVTPTAPGVGMDLPVPSSVWRTEPFCRIIRRKLMPNLEHLTWSDPTVTPSKLAISSRLNPCATNTLIFSKARGVNFARLPLADGLAFVIVVMASSTVITAHQWIAWD